MNKRLIRTLRTLFALVLAAAAALAGTAYAADFDYRLHPQRIADDTWVVYGHKEDFTTGNGGNIVNTAFVATGAGVLVIDSGPSRRYGEQLVRAIAGVTDEPVVMVLNTHFHPDHFLGNQAFASDTLRALGETRSAIAASGNAFAENVYRLSGDWLLGTEVVVPPRAIETGPLTLGRHRFEVLALSGHTGADLALFDRTTGVLFAGDLVFNGRAPTTPHAEIGRWLEALDRLAGLAPRLVVPGHGAVGGGESDGIAQTRAYLRWLEAALRDAAEQGLDMTEALALPLPAEVRRLAVAEAEFRRSISHLYPAAERQVLERQHRH